MAYPIVSDESFLGLHGNAYSHNTYLWILVKTGIVGLALILGGIILTVVVNKGTALSYESHLFRSLLASLLIVAFIWNILANAPDSTLLGAIMGLILASHRNPGFISTELPAEPKED
jgi:hypothetical protein